jgi:hypothetical protein
MKRMLAGLTLAIATAALSGCYYDPGYSYVRSAPYAGDAYYGSGTTVVYDDGYYAPAYYGGYYGCCWAPPVTVGISGIWYGGSRYHGHDRRYWDRGGHSRGSWGGGRGHWGDGRGRWGDHHH